MAKQVVSDELLGHLYVKYIDVQAFYIRNNMKPPTFEKFVEKELGKRMERVK